MTELAHQQLEHLCEELKLQNLSDHYLDMAQKAADNESAT